MKNGVSAYYSVDLCIHEQFEKHAAAAPNATALVLGGTEYTYSELNRKANQLANYLIKRGVRANSRVGVCIDRSCEMVTAVLAVLKAGEAYVPFDSSYPKARLARMLQEIKLKHLLSMNALLDILPEDDGSVITLDGDKDQIAQRASITHGRELPLAIWPTLSLPLAPRVNLRPPPTIEVGETC